MLGVRFPAVRTRSHHVNMFIVKLRESAAGAARGVAGEDMLSTMEEAPGLAAVTHAERSGNVRRVAHLRRRTRRRHVEAAHDWGAAVRLAADDRKRGHEHAGAVLIEFTERTDTDRVRRALEDDPHIDHVSRVPVRYALAPRKIPFPPMRHWNLDRIGWKAAHALNGLQDPDDVLIAVIDSGVDRSHPGLRGAIRTYHYQQPDLPASPSEKDLVGHGTHVAGIIAARPNGRLDAQGCCQGRLNVWKVFDDDAPYDEAHDTFLYFVDPVMYRRALSDAIDQGVAVVNLSIGGSAEPDPHEQALIRTLIERGTTVVAAMGNGRTIGSPTMYPAAVPGVVAVGATDPNDTIAPFSSRGRHIALTAPGVSIWSTLPQYEGQFGFAAIPPVDGRHAQGAPVSRNTWYDSWLGTSMATPHVTAAVALLRANRPEITGDEVRAHLMRTADRVTGMQGEVFTPDYGAGRLNLHRLLTE